MNVAVVVAGGLTETLQAAPLLAALASRGTGTHVLLAGPPEAAQLRGVIRGVDEVIALPALAGHGAGPAALARGVVALRRHRLDAALLCSRRARDLLLVYGAGCPRRVSESAGLSSVLLTSSFPRHRHGNRAAAWLRLGGPLGAPASTDEAVLDPGEVARRRAEALLVGGGLEDGRLLVAVVPGATEPDTGPGDAALRWDPESYAHLTNQLAVRHGACVVVLGGMADRGLVDRMLLDMEAPTLDLTAELSLVETAAVAARCDLVIGADTPLIHLAACMGVPTLGLYGPTDARLRSPLGRRHRMLQAVSAGGRERGPMSNIRVEDVLAALQVA